MKKQILFIALMLMPLMANADYYRENINGIYYNLNSTDKVAEVTCQVTERYEFHHETYVVYYDPYPSYEGVIVIPETIIYCGVTYSVTSIDNSAFYGCTGLTSVTIPYSVTSIGYDAFSNCSGLTFLNIPNSVTSIGHDAFHGCSGLTSLNIPNSVTSIGSGAFYGCSKLSSVSIGKGIKSVGSKAFANCPEIKEVYCYAKDVPTIYNSTFENSYYIKYATLYVPESSIEQYKMSAWSQFGNIVGITGGNEDERCAKPVITLLANGKIKVECVTEGATCVTNITASNAEPLSNGEISLNTPLTVYTVTSYATKEGYNDSEVATATFRYEKTEGDMNGDGMLNITDVIHLVNMILGQ